MLEQLQTLMKALEAGSYNAVPQNQEKESMNFTLLLRDNTTGDIVFEGYVTKYTLNINATSLDKISVEAIRKPNRVSSHRKSCDHKWKKYEGITSNYEYCEICDEKK